MSDLTPRSLDQALGLLGELMAARDHPMQHFVDRDGGRHLQDLLDLAPTANELLDAAKWTRTQDPSEAYLFNLRSLLRELGHENLNDKL